MNKRFEIETYGVGSYDDFFCLRPPWLLIASLIFLCRSIVAIGAFGLGGNGAEDVLSFVDKGALWSGCLAAVPALLVLYAAVARAPTAPAFVKWSWKHGRRSCRCRP
jgi:hypothetical protein